MRSWMSSSMGQIEQEHLELFALEFEKIAEPDFVSLYHLQILTSQHQSWSKCIVIIRTQMSSIMDLIRPELSELSVLELENLPHLNLFTL